MSHDDEPAPEAEKPEAEPRPRGRRRRRLKKWIFLALLATAAYWAASFGVRPTAERWLSQTLDSPVRVTRVGFEPLDAVITLEGLVTRIPGEGLSLGTPIVADRARLDLQWFPLIHKRLHIRELTLEGAVIELDEAPNLVPSLEALGAPGSPKTLPPEWTVQVDRLAIRDSLLKLRALGTTKQPIEVRIQEAEVTATRRRTSQLGAATNLRLDASFEGGNLKATGHWALREDGLTVMADVKAEDLPVARVLKRMPELGIDSLSGRLEADLRYVLEADHRNMLSGFARLRDAKIQTPDRTTPSVEVRNAIADIAGLDLNRRRLHVRSLVLRGATFAPEAQIGSTVLSSLADERRKKRGLRDEDEVRPWRWSVDRFDATGAQLRIPDPTRADESEDPEASEDSKDPEDAIALVTTIRGENLGPRSHWSPIKATFQHGLGSAEFEGSVRTSYEEPRLEGKLSASEVDLSSLAHEIGFAGARLIQSGRVSANLDVLLEPGSAGFGVNGIISVIGASVAVPQDELALLEKERRESASTAPPAGDSAPPPEPAPTAEAPPSTATDRPTVTRPYVRPRIGPDGQLLPEDEGPDLLEVFTFGAARVDFGVNAPAPKRTKRGRTPPRRWNLDATLTAPFVHIGLDEDGWVVPPIEPPEPEGAAKTAGEDAPIENDDSETREREQDEPKAPLTLDEILRPVTLGRLAVVRGHIRLEDDSAEPPLTFDVSEITGTATEIKPLPFSAQEIFLQGYGADLGLIEVRAHEASEFGGLEIAAEEIPLYLTGPYLERLKVPYRFTNGRGSFVAELTRAPEGWNADTLLILNRPVIDPWTEDLGQTGPLGMPLSAAFKLLRDRNGDIRVRVPRLDGLDQEFDLAVLDAIQTAHEAPGSGGALAPTTIGFRPGQSELSPNAHSRLRSIARTVASFPNLRIELAAPASLQDRRWFKEKAVLENLDDRGGLMGALRLLGATDEKERIRRALQARVRGRSWYLEPHEEEVLQELLADAPPVSQAQIEDLARRRLATVEKLFLQERIPYGRLSRREISGQDRTTLAAVVVTVRTTSGPRRALVEPQDRL